VQQRQEVLEPGLASGYGHRTLTVLGLTAACLLALVAVVRSDRRSARVPLEVGAELESSISPEGRSVLAAGDTVTLGAGRTRVERLPPGDLRSRLAWTAGLIQLDGKNLTEAVAEFNRYNRKKLTIADPAIADLRVSGTFSAREPESFVATLARSGDVRELAPGSRTADSQVIRLVGANPGP
jgi:ferric-dicitrate binding protein FerR (iron transport regulator)